MSNRFDKNRSDRTDDFFYSILMLKNKNECYDFFEDLKKKKKIQSIAQRYTVAKLLKSGMTYQQIEEATGASSATISKVSQSLNYGKGGYDIAISRLEKKKAAF